MRVAVIGAGSWGTTVACLAAENADVVLWARRPELAEAIRGGRNPDYLPDFPLPSFGATSNLDEALDGADIVVLGVPSHGLRAVLEDAAGLIAPDRPIISLVKGIERGTHMRMTEVVADVLPEHNRRVVGVLSGPNLAKEIMQQQPAATVVAVRDEDWLLKLQGVFITGHFRVYTNNDVVGCEIAGATKNVMALAAGAAHGLGFGMNTVSTMMTRALAEIVRLGVAMGGNPLTFGGLAGVGDLVATCMSTQSRNHTVGYRLGTGEKLDDIIADMNMVAEGVKGTEGIVALADRHDVDMPIAREVAKVLYEGKSTPDALHTLMTREAKAEGYGIID